MYVQVPYIITQLYHTMHIYTTLARLTRRDRIASIQIFGFKMDPRLYSH